MRALPLSLLSSLVLSAAAYAEFIPDCGAPGDPVLLCGQAFGEDPTVTFGGVEAQVLKSSDEKILLRVPDGLAVGEATITVNGTDEDRGFVVLREGAPVIQHVSSETATPGQRLLLIGLRLRGADVEFVDGDGLVQGTAELEGRSRAGFIAVPASLAAGSYTLRVTNGDGLDSGDCSPGIDVVEPGEATIDAIDPAGALPGQFVEMTGHDLGPGGFVSVEWVSGATTLKSFGFSNGFDRIHTRVPFKADFETTYDVSVRLFEANATSTLAYDVGSPGTPLLNRIDPAGGPAGSLVRITGTELVVFSAFPNVTLTSSDGVATEAKVLFLAPGFGEYPAGILFRVPTSLADGDYDVRVAVGQRVSNTLVFRVGEQPLSVTDLSPTSSGRRFQPVFLEGTGFGVFGSDDIDVVWDDGTTRRKGFVVLRSDTRLIVLPPGGLFRPLPAGEYEVSVERSGSSVIAGTFTVN